MTVLPSLLSDAGWVRRFGIAEGSVAQANICLHLEAAAGELAQLRGLLMWLVRDIEEHERVNNLAPNPGRKHCWDSVARVYEMLGADAMAANRLNIHHQSEGQ